MQLEGSDVEVWAPPTAAPLLFRILPPGDGRTKLPLGLPNVPMSTRL